VSVFGSSVAESILGSSGNDMIVAGAGADTITAGAGSDFISGGSQGQAADSFAGAQASEADIAIFAGNRSDYRIDISNDPTKLLITHLTSGAIDTVTGIEQLRFQDTVFAVGALRPVLSLADTSGSAMREAAHPDGFDLVVTVTRSGDTSVGFSTNWEVVPGGGANNLADFRVDPPGQKQAQVAGVLSFAPGETQKTFRLGAAKDADSLESDESFSVRLSLGSDWKALRTPAILVIRLRVIRTSHSPFLAMKLAH
jgi:Ca2+-binding RTX toxin-like protein